MKATLIERDDSFYIQFGNSWIGYKFLDNSMNIRQDAFDYKWISQEHASNNASFDTIEDARAKWELYKEYKQRHKFIHKKIKPLK